MDPITIIVTALIAGAAAGGQDAASAVVRDLYTALRNRINRGGDPEAVAAIEANEKAPGSNVDEIAALLDRRNNTPDSEAEAAAKALLAQLPSSHVEQARAQIDLRRAQGVQIGDNNVQHNNFG
ncbi:hypothetical protein ACWIGI_39425 [Nocardia sp. NPDC055321]